MDSNNNEQEIREVQLEEYALKLDAKDFSCRSKAKAKPQIRDSAGSSPRTVLIGKRTWTDVEPGKYFPVIHNKCIEKKMEQFIFGEIKENLQSQFPHSPHWADSKCKACLAGGGGDKRRFQYCTDASGTIVDFRALQGHSGRNLIDLSLQDNVVIQSNFFQYILHIGCAFNLHSIINSGLISGGQNSNKRQAVFFLPVDPMDQKITRILM